MLSPQIHNLAFTRVLFLEIKLIKFDMNYA